MQVFIKVLQSFINGFIKGINTALFCQVYVLVQETLACSLLLVEETFYLICSLLLVEDTFCVCSLPLRPPNISLSVQLLQI